MGRKWWIALAVICACSKSKTAEQAPAAPVVSAPGAADATAPTPPPTDAAPPPHPVVRVEKGAPLKVGRLTFALRSYTTDEGEGAVIKMSIAGDRVTFSDPPPGGAPKLTAWVGGVRAQVVDHGPDFVALHVDRLTDEVVPDSEMKVRVAHRKSVDIGGGVSLRFLGHGHKTVAAGGPPSPLMVAVEYQRDGKRIGSSDLSLYPPEESRWKWREHTFHLTDYEYGSFMVLKVTRRQLAPVEAK